MHQPPTPDSAPRKPQAAGRLSWGARYLLAAFVVLSSLSVFVMICIPDHAPTASAGHWRARSDAAATTVRTAVVVAALVSLRLSTRNGSVASPGGFYPAYFMLTAVGVGLSLLIVLLHSKGDPIDNCANLLQATAWLMTSVLSMVAAKSNRSALATQWLARSAAVGSTCLAQFLLTFIPGHASLGSDKMGLESGLLVFAAFMTADVALSWRYITVKARGGKPLSQ